MRAEGDGVPREVFGQDTGRLDNRELAGLKRRAKGEDVDDGIPREEIAGETLRLDTTELNTLLEKTGGVPFAIGTPGNGLPQLEGDEPEISVVEVEAAPVGIEREPSMPTYRHSRARDFLIGGAISLCGLIVWYCATQL